MQLIQGFDELFAETPEMWGVSLNPKPSKKPSKTHGVLIASCYRIINAINHLQTVGIWLVSDINWVSYVCSPQWWLITLLIHRVSSPHGCINPMRYPNCHGTVRKRTEPALLGGAVEVISGYVSIYIYIYNIIHIQYIYIKPMSTWS